MILAKGLHTASTNSLKQRHCFGLSLFFCLTYSWVEGSWATGTEIEQFLATHHYAGNLVFAIHVVPVLNEDPERRLPSPWVLREAWATEDLRRSQRPVELFTKCGWSYDMLIKAGMQVCLISCYFTDCFCLRNPSRSCQDQVDSLLSIQAKLFISNFPIDSHFPKILLVKIRLRQSCLLLPCQGGFCLCLRSSTGCEPAPMRGEQLLFAKLGAWWPLAKPVQKSLCLLTILSSYCNFISVTCNLCLMPNQHVSKLLMQLLSLKVEISALGEETGNNNYNFYNFCFQLAFFFFFFWLLLLKCGFWTYTENAWSLQSWGRLKRGPSCLCIASIFKLSIKLFLLFCL